MTTYTSQYPTLDTDHVKATNYDSATYYPHFAADSSKSLTGSHENTSWLTALTNYANMRFHFDLGSTYIIRRIYLENFHVSGTTTNMGVNSYTFWGSNSSTSFNELTYATDTGWTQLHSGSWDAHVSADQADPQYAVVSNTTAYQYYAFKFSNNQGSSERMGVRRIELQTEDGYGEQRRIAPMMYY